MPSIALLLLFATNDRLSAAGESCQRTADCVEPLSCVANTCVTREKIAPQEKVQPQPIQQQPIQPREIRPVRRVGPYKIPYNKGDPIPEGAVVVTRTQPALWGSGIALFTLAYFTSAGATSIACTKGCVPWVAPVAWIPLAGPFIDLAVSAPDFMPFLVLSGLAEAGGTAMIVLGVMLKKSFLVVPAGPPNATVVPTANGAALVGTF